MKKPNDLGAYIWVCVLLILLVWLWCDRSRGDSIKWPKQRSQKQVSEVENTTVYLMGYAKHADVFNRAGRDYTNVVLEPFASNILFERRMTFCGDQSAMIEGHSLFLVFTYNRVMQDGNCNQLIGVNSVESDKP